MKNSKRILGVALALIMIFNVFAVGTFAAFPDDTAVKLAIRSDKATYAQGEVITLTFSEQVIAEVGPMLIGGQYDIGYNSSVFELLSDDIEKLESHNFVAIADGYDAGISGVQIPSSAGVSDIYGWDTAVTWNVGDDSTSFDATEMTDLFTVQIKVKDDAANGTYTIGFNPAGYEGYNAYSADAANGGLYGVSGTDMGLSVANMYEYGTCEITVGAEAPVEYDLKWVQNQWRNSVNVEGAYDVGVKFGFDVSDIDIQFEGTRSTNVARVGAKIYDANGDEMTGPFESEFVYEVGTEYHYRVILEGLAKDDTAEYTITPYLVYTDESLDVVYGETVTVCAADVIPQ